MSLAIFDLDNTLQGGDSDELWGRFMVDNAIVEDEGFGHPVVMDPDPILARHARQRD